MKKSLVFSFLAFIAVPLCVYATARKSDLDTLEIGDVSAISTGTVRVPILMKNTFPVSGLSFRITYDPSVLSLVKVDTVGGRVAGVYSRTSTANNKEEGWVFWMGLNFEDPYNNHISVGSGPIAYLHFNVSKNVRLKKAYHIRFEQNLEAGHYNALSTQDGQLVFPLLENGSLDFTGAAFGTQNDAVAESSLPMTYFLGDCYPNPFEDETRICYACPRSEDGSVHITLRVYDSNGRLARTMVDGEKDAGWHVVEWDAQSNSGRPAPAGVYFCRMEADGNIVGIRKLILLR